MKKEKKRLEFSKKILITAAILNFMVVIFAGVMMWRTMDTTPLAYLIPAVSAEVATGTGFYYNKAKAENKLKLMRDSGVEPTEDSFKDGPII